ncbi:MAG: hypothetical protein WC554_12510 [Clostridia bacterium]
MAKNGTGDIPFSTTVNRGLIKRIRRLAKVSGKKIKHLTETGFVAVLKEYERD